MNIHVHLTPYQVQDDRRPWIRKEEKLFTEMLRRLNAPITRHLHYDNQPANLMTHFEVLQAFCQHVHALNQQQQQLQQQQQGVGGLAISRRWPPTMGATTVYWKAARRQSDSCNCSIRIRTTITGVVCMQCARVLPP